MNNPQQTLTLRPGATLRVRQSIWARTGTPVNLPASSPDVLTVAGLDWEPALRPLSTTDMDGNPVSIARHQAVIRQDTGDSLGVVGPAYTLASNRSLVDAMSRISDAQGAVIEHAGVFNGGAKVWLQAKIPRLSFAIGEDAHDAILTVNNSHDGTQSLSLEFHILRLVCTNGLMVQQMVQRKAFRHTLNVNRNLSQVADQYAYALACYEAQQAALRTLATKAATAQTMAAIVNAAWEVTADSLKDEADRAQTIRRNREADIRRIRNSPTCNVVGTAGTVFSDLQAVTEYVDHVQGAGDNAAYVLGTTAEAVKARALDAALAMV